MTACDPWRGQGDLAAAAAVEAEGSVVVDPTIVQQFSLGARDEQGAQPAPLSPVACLAYRGAGAEPRRRSVPEETPVAFTYDGTSYAVMMATPSDLADFALGFSLSEGVIGRPADIASLDIVPHETGIELRMWLASTRGAALGERRHRLAGPTGCGLCGVESLASAVPPIRPVGAGITLAPEAIAAALPALVAAQELNSATRAMHAAGFFVPDHGLISVREDVGRHNALDKLVGDLAGRAIDGATGFVVVTSRVSVEMVQKTATLGAGIVVAISAPTALAIRSAERAGITLVAIARDDGFEVFTHPHRIAARS